MENNSLNILEDGNDVVIFNPSSCAWYFTTKEGLKLFQCFDLRGKPLDIEEKEFLDEITNVLFQKSASVKAKYSGVTIHVTRNCNMKCQHCRGANGIFDDDLGMKVIKQFIDEAVASGVESFSLTGGEPLTKWNKTRDILEYIRAKKSNAPIQLLTNGSLVSIEIARALSDLNVVVQVSLDTLQPDIFRNFRGCEIESVLKGIDFLVSAGVAVNISMVLTKFNQHELPELINFCIDRKIKGLHFPFLEKGGRGESNWNFFALTDEELICSLKFLMNIYYQNGLREKLMLVDFESVTERILYPRKASSCQCGRQTAALYPDGKIYLCTNLVGDKRYCIGDMMPGFFNNMTQSLVACSLPTINDVQECRKCNVNWLCLGGCKDRVNLFYGDMFHPDPWCKVLQWWFKEMLFTVARLAEEGKV